MTKGEAALYSRFLRKSSGSLAMLAAIRRASSLLSRSGSSLEDIGELWRLITDAVVRLDNSDHQNSGDENRCLPSTRRD